MPDAFLLHPLHDDLWEKHGHFKRSAELTPLYVEKYCGPRSRARLSRHDYWEFIFVFQGEGEFLGEKTFELEKHTALLIPPGMEHNESQPKRSLGTLWMGLRGDTLAELNAKRLYVCKRASDLEGHLDELWLMAHSSRTRCGCEIDALTQFILSRFLRLCEVGEQSSLIEKAIRWMQENFRQDFSVGQLAQDLGCSERFLYRRFRAETGQSPAAFMTELRLRQAVQLLHHSHLSIKQVAKRVGYADQLYFSRVFKKGMGKSPSEFREGD